MKRKLPKVTILAAVSLVTLSACQNTASDDQQQESTSTSQSSSKQSSNNSTSNINTVQFSLNSALKKFQEIYPSAAVSEVDLEVEDGILRYEIAGLDTDREYELVLDAGDGTEIRRKTEDLDDDEQTEEHLTVNRINLDGLKSLKQIAAVAEDSLPDGKITEWNLDRDDGNAPLWEIIIETSSKRIKAIIDPYTGELVRNITEDDDD